jgi:hypothetical protein
MYLVSYNEQNDNHNFNDFYELQFIKGNQLIEINALGPNLWISHEWEYSYASVDHRYL